MPVMNDGDIVRGLGFVTLYAAYMEEAIDECSQVLLQRDPKAPNRIDRWPISERVKYMQERLAAHAPLPEELAALPTFLDHIGVLLARRNEVVHGRIYGGMQGDQDELRPGRPGGSAKPITPEELYDLANALFETLGTLNHASMFAIHRMP
jgi:hypothetical protein